MLNPQTVLLFASFLFCAGLYGVLSRRNLIMLLMSLELILNAVNISLVAYSRYWAGQGADLIPAHTGQFFTLMVMAVAAAEVGIGLAIIVAVYRRLRTADTDAAVSLRN
ncbi:MAG: NADH-quinone oxidoreductase subunit NuoK [Planctomycetota bacterium]|jgi:NADH-quinone oxidoreductase subunit K